MNNYELNERGQQYVDDKLEPYQDLVQILTMLRIGLSEYNEKYAMEMQNAPDLYAAYEFISDGMIAAEDEIPDLDKMAEDMAVNLMGEKQFRQKNLG